MLLPQSRRMAPPLGFDVGGPYRRRWLIRKDKYTKGETLVIHSPRKTTQNSPAMDEYEKLRGVGKYQFLKNTLQIVISVAFLSIFLSHSSSFAYSLFPHSFNVYFSTFLFSFFTHTLERKYMFLLCNGILAFIAKTSVSAPSTSTASVTETKLASDVDGGRYDHISHVPLQVEEPEKGSLEEEEEEEEASVVVGDDTSGGKEDKEREKGCQVKQEEEVAVSISTEELNRKIEEFIRKMKEEIRIEAQQQQQLIASN